MSLFAAVQQRRCGRLLADVTVAWKDHAAERRALRAAEQALVRRRDTR
jgi:hypothetical protein